MSDNQALIKHLKTAAAAVLEWAEFSKLGSYITSMIIWVVYLIITFTLINIGGI